MAAPRVRRRGLSQRDRLTLTLMTLGTVLVLTALVLLHRLTPAPTEFGSVSPAVAASRPSPAAAVVAAAPGPGSAAPVMGPRGAVPAPPASTGATAPGSAPAVAAGAPLPPGAAPAVPGVPGPARAAVARSISIPVLGVTAPVQPIGSSNGVVEVPEDPAQVGFYTGSVLPGSPAGSTVLVGHVNYGNVPGALIGLTAVQEGDVVQVVTIDGRTLDYRIAAREVFVKTEGLPADLFSTAGPARLVLITCGGRFDTVAQRYDDNVVVVATPVP